MSACRFIDGDLRGCTRPVGEASQPQSTRKNGERSDPMIKAKEVCIDGSKLSRAAKATFAIELCGGLVSEQMVRGAQHPIRDDEASRVIDGLRDVAGLF